MNKLAPGFLVAALAVHLALLVGWRWQYPVLPYFFDATVLTGGRGIDFYAIYQAGYNARHGVDIYENDPAQAPIVVPHFTPYRYLPIVAYTLGAALSLFPSLTAYKIWLVIVELTLLTCAALAWRAARDRSLSMLLAAMWLGFTPYYLELFMGQFSLAQAALLWGMLLLVPESTDLQESRPGALLETLWITSILWKINTLILAPVFLRLRRFRPLLAAALLGALVTVPYFLIFPAHLLDLLRNNFGGSVTGYELGNLGFRQLVFELLAALGAPASLQRFAQFTVVAIILGLCLWLTFPGAVGLRRPAGKRAAFTRRPACHSPRPAASLSLWLTAFFLVSPQIWENHYLMLLPALAITLRQTWSKPAAWFVFLIWLAIALPTPFGFIGLQPQLAANHDLRGFALYPLWRPLLEHACKAAPTLLFFVYLARSLALDLQPAEKNAVAN